MSIRFACREHGSLGMRPKIMRIVARLAVALFRRLPILGEHFEQEIGRVHGELEQRHREHHRHRFVQACDVSLEVDDRTEPLRVGLDGGQDKRGKDERKQRGTVDVRVGERENYRQAQAEAEVVGPAGLDVRYTLPNVPAHVAELVLERVQRVQERQVYVTQQLIEHARRHQSHQ